MPRAPELPTEAESMEAGKEGVSRALGVYFGKLRVFKGTGIECVSVEFFWVWDILAAL